MTNIIKEDEYIGKKININTTFMLGDDDVYTVTLEFSNERSLDGEKWEKKVTSLKVLDDNPDRAYAQAASVLHEYLKDFDFNLFNEQKGLAKPNV